MSAVVFQLREFQTVRDSVRAAGLNPVPLFDQLRRAQLAGDRGLAVVAAAQKLCRQFRDELPPGAA